MLLSYSALAAGQSLAAKPADKGLRLIPPNGPRFYRLAGSALVSRPGEPRHDRTDFASTDPDALAR